MLLSRPLGMLVLVVGLFALGIPPSCAIADNVQELVRLRLEVNNLILAKQYAQAEAAGKRFVEFTESKFVDDPAVRVMASGDVAGLYHIQNKYAEAEPHMYRVLFLSDYLTHGDDIYAVPSLNLVALAYSSEKRFAEAERLYKRALLVTENVHGRNHADIANILTHLGLAAQQQSRLPEAEAYYRRALAMLEATQGPNSDMVAFQLVSLTNILFSQKRYDEGELPLRRALAIAERSPTAQASLIGGLSFLAQLHIERRQYDQAEAVHRRGLELTRQQNLMLKSVFIAAKQEKIAAVLRLQKRYPESEKLLVEIIQGLNTEYGNGNQWLTSPLTELSRVTEDQGQFASAIKTLDLVITIEERTGGVPWQTLLRRARLRWQAQERDQALVDLNSAITKAEQLRQTGSGGEQERSQYFGSLLDVFETAVAWHTELGHLDEAFAAMERGKARSLIDQMQLRGVDLLAGVPAEEAQRLRGKETAYRVHIAALQARLDGLANETNLSAADRAAQRQKLESELTARRREFQEVYRDIRNASPAYRLAVMKEFQPASLADVQTWCDSQKAMLVSYLVSDDRAFVLLAGQDAATTTLQELRLDAEQARTLEVPEGAVTTTKLNQLLMNVGKTGVLDLLRQPTRDRDALPKLAALYQVLLPATAREALQSGQVKLLAIVPDGPLGLLPFETLVIESGNAPRYLLDADVPVVYSPSATVLLNLTERKQPPTPTDLKPVLTVGDPNYTGKSATAEKPSILNDVSAKSRFSLSGGKLAQLPFSKTESIWVADGFAENGLATGKLLQNDATEAKLKYNVPGRRYVHLACHGLTDQQHGNFFGCLALTPGPKAATDLADDGFLTLPEIYELDLKSCELAILSACETNFGPQQRGEGVWALSRGFLVAGSRRVVASSWLVDDEAAASLVSYFCSGVARAEKKGETPDYAKTLHLAKKWVRQQEKWQSPYFWGTFVIAGAR